MTTIPGLTLKEVAASLDVSQQRLRQFLFQQRAVVKTDFGWAAAPEFHKRGLLYTQTRQHTIATDHSYIPKHYTVVLVTGDGLAWLQSHFQSTSTGDAA